MLLVVYMYIVIFVNLELTFDYEIGSLVPIKRSYLPRASPPHR